jgi:hypothetical protein
MKLHVSMRVEDLDKAMSFYSTLFDLQPILVRENYAKWDVTDPAVNFVVESGRGTIGFDHIGIQVDSEEQLADLATRMKDSANPFLDVESTDCCFAKMDKAWVRGEADEPWEGFLTHNQDNENYGTDREKSLPMRDTTVVL